MDYTPTTEEMRETYQDWMGRPQAECFAEFDRWLAEVKAQAWDDGHNQPTFNADGSRYIASNPYRQGENK